MRYNAGQHTRLRASWGRFYQSQGINELQVEDGVDRFYPAQHANHTIFSIEHSLPNRLDMRMEFYRKDYRTVNPRFENLFDPLVLLPELEFDRVRIAPETARADGAELWLNWRPNGNWSGWLSYTWSQVQDRVGGEDIYRSWDQRHAASLGVAWVDGPWAVTVAIRFTPDGRLLSSVLRLYPVTRPLSGHAMPCATTTSTRWMCASPAPSIWPMGSWTYLSRSTNLASRANPCCTEYRLVPDAAGNAVLQSDTDSWLPLVPSIGVLWRYGRER